MKKACIYLGFFFALTACQQADQTGSESAQIEAAPAVTDTYELMADADQAPPERPSANSQPEGVPEILPEGKQFIRTADARIKVKEVETAVRNIEQSLRRLGGHITQKNLSSQVQNTRTVEVSPDSSLLLTLFRLEANLTLRVPNQYLDSLVQDLSTQVVLVENQTLSADDVSLQLLEKKLQRRRHQESIGRLQQAPGHKSAKLTDATKAEEARLDKQLQADAALLAGLQLKDRIEYSTVTLHLYQSPRLSRELVVNPEAANHLKDYEPGFGTRLITAITAGWEMLAWLLLGLVKLWGVFALIGLGWVAFRQLRKWQAHA